MRIPRLYQPSPLAPGIDLELDELPARHVTTVLRLRAGDAVELFDGQGNAGHGEIIEVTRHRVMVQLSEVDARSLEAPLAVTLALGVAKGERMDFSIQKSVELGVADIVPLTTERSVVRLSGERAERRLTHWRGVAVSACEQCGRNHLPGVAAPMPLDRWLETIDTGGTLALMPTPGASDGLQALGPPASGRVSVLIGPEGGLSPGERDAAVGAGFTPIRLGPRVLRTETAALAALAAIMTLWGDLGRSAAAAAPGEPPG